MKMILFQVAVGGAIGACARFAVSLAALRLFGRGFPYGTLAINVAGSFLMGLLVVILTERGDGRWAPLLLTGVLGGFTTFSAFSLDTLALIERGQSAAALVYVAMSVMLSLLAVAAGLALARGGIA